MFMLALRYMFITVSTDRPANNSANMFHSDSANISTRSQASMFTSNSSNKSNSDFANMFTSASANMFTSASGNSQHAHQWLGQHVHQWLGQHVHQWLANMLTSGWTNMFTSELEKSKKKKKKIWLTRFLVKLTSEYVGVVRRIRHLIRIFLRVISALIIFPWTNTYYRLNYFLTGDWIFV